MSTNVSSHEALRMKEQKGAMDPGKILAELHKERDRIDEAILCFERLVKKEAERRVVCAATKMPEKAAASTPWRRSA